MTQTAPGPLDVLFDIADKVLSTTQSAMPVELFSDFVDTVTWSEPFIRYLLLCQIVFYGLVFATRRMPKAQITLFLLSAGLIFSARRLNQIGKQSWQTFATQDYFDTPGLFVTIFMSGPLLIANNFIMCNMLYRSAMAKSRMVRTKQTPATKSMGTPKTSSNSNDNTVPSSEAPAKSAASPKATQDAKKQN